MSSTIKEQCDRIRPLMTNESDVNEDDIMEEAVEDKRIVGEEGGDEEATTEESTTKMTRSPTVPSTWERERHEVAHIPYRSWCPICVAGRGVKSPHKARPRTSDDLPRFSMDYGFLGDEGQPTSVLLVMKEITTGMMMAMIVPRKGIGARDEEWIHRRLSQFINGFGFKKILLRSDNENAILALRKKIADGCTAQVLEEDSIKGESQTNGLAEVGVRIVEGIMRTLIIDVEVKTKTKVGDSSVVMAWLAEHACTVYNRCTVMSDGRTPWQKAYGKASSLSLVPFGERVLEEAEEHWRSQEFSGA